MGGIHAAEIPHPFARPYSGLKQCASFRTRIRGIRGKRRNISLRPTTDATFMAQNLMLGASRRPGAVFIGRAFRNDRPQVAEPITLYLSRSILFLRLWPWLSGTTACLI